MMKAILFDISTAARKQKAHDCCHYLYQLETPNWSQETHRSRYGHKIRIGNNRNEAAIIFDEEQFIPLRTHYSDGTERGQGWARIARWIQFRFPDGTAYELDDTQKEWIKNWIKNNVNATIEQLMLVNGGTPANLPAVPNWIQIVTLDELEAMDNFK